MSKICKSPSGSSAIMPLFCKHCPSRGGVLSFFSGKKAAEKRRLCFKFSQLARCIRHALGKRAPLLLGLSLEITCN